MINQSAVVYTFPQPEPPAPAWLKLDLACGNNKTEGFLGVDICDIPGVDFVADLANNPWPFEDSSVSEVVSNHFLEHLDGKQQIHFMNELHRVLRPLATAKLVTPYGGHIRAWQDPTHQRPIFAECFLYYNAAWRKANKLEHYPITADFDATIAYSVDNEMAARNEVYRQFAFKYYSNAIVDLITTLTCLK